jgi:glycosyltransferase involved in cell wall biosynthesis
MTIPRHILVLNYEYPPVGGGAGQVTQNLCGIFADHGIRQTVITGWIPGLSWSEQGENLTVIRVPMLKCRRDRTSVVGMASYLLTAFFPLLWIIMNRKIDLIHAHFMLPVGILAGLSRVIFGVPYIITLHGGDVPGMVPEQTDGLFRFFKKTAIWVSKKANAVVSVSEGLRRLAGKTYPVDIRVIPNGIASSWIQNGSGGKPFDAGTTHLVAGGRLTHQKNIGAVIRAVRLLTARGKWHLHIVGDGPLMDMLKKETGDLDCVTFHGWLSPDAVKDILTASDIFLLPSYSEGLSVAALQAMARGCALVVSDIPMNHDILEEGVNGYFCGHDPESIASSIYKCLPMLAKLKQGSLAKIRAFEWPLIGRQYIDIFEDVVEKDKSR